MAHAHVPASPRQDSPTSTGDNLPHGAIAAVGIILALAQAVGLGLLVAGGRGFDLLPALGGGLYRIDALGVALGTVFALAVALGWPRSARPLPALLLLIGLLHLAYSREPLLLYLGWEAAGLGLLLAADVAARRAPVALLASGVPLLVAWLLGLVPALSPPPGGDPQPWPAAVAAALGLVVLMRSGVPLLGGWLRPLAERAPFPAALYVLAGPAVLARALVPAPWDALGGWLLALLGAAGMVAALLAFVWGDRGIVGAASVLAAGAVMGLGLASVSPVVAVGAVLLMLVGPVWLCCRTLGRRAWGVLLLAGAAPGAWVLSQGAVTVGYEVVPVLALGGIALPALLLAADGEPGRLAWPALAAGVLLVLVAVYPQAAVEWAARPAVGAMAGGVGVPSGLLANWGVGLALRAPDETLQAALPATGIALAVLVAWAAVRWLKLLAGRAAREPEER
ncbi:MAG TPA: hypothetical protein VFR15_16300 [Chloroflexia bacterium]|nr:hypothetical protein [Chloroflexia bacterium]